MVFNHPHTYNELPLSHFSYFFHISLSLVFSAAVTRKCFRSCVVRVGGDVTLPCENMIKDQHNCESTTWLFNDKGQALPQVERGKIHKDVKAKSHRLSVTENCSLVIKNVTAEDAGHYFCRQFKSGNQHGGDLNVYLSVTTSKCLHHSVFHSDCLDQKNGNITTVMTT